METNKKEQKEALIHSISSLIKEGRAGEGLISLDDVAGILSDNFDSAELHVIRTKLSDLIWTNLTKKIDSFIQTASNFK